MKGPSNNSLSIPEWSHSAQAPTGRGSCGAEAKSTGWSACVSFLGLAHGSVALSVKWLLLIVPMPYTLEDEKN